MRAYLFIMFFLFLSVVCFSQTTSVAITNGSMGATWSIPTLSSTITKAGKNYEHVETSALSHTYLKVTSIAFWNVSVQQTVSSNWDPSLKLFVRRSGDGTGLVTISGGTAFLPVTSGNTLFFSGLLGLGFGRENIPVQYKIEGLSVLLPVKTYTTTIVFTISGL